MPRREYLALFGSLVLVALEVLVRVITLGLRESSVTSALVASNDSRSSTRYSLLLQHLQESVQWSVLGQVETGSVGTQVEVQPHRHLLRLY